MITAWASKRVLGISVPRPPKVAIGIAAARRRRRLSNGLVEVLVWAIEFVSEERGGVGFPRAARDEATNR